MQGSFVGSNEQRTSDMDTTSRQSSDPSSPPPKTRKKRIPKACGSCRRSKVRCDGQRPCSRCSNLKKICVFTEPPKDEQERKIELLEGQVEALKAQLDAASPATQRSHLSNDSFGPLEARSAPVSGIMPQDQDASRVTASLPLPVPPSTNFTPSANLLASTSTASPAVTGSFQPPPHFDPATTSPSTTFHSGSLSAKRKRSHFTVEPVLTDDFVTTGLISLEDAEAYFTAFFQGCYQYVPVFDPRYDSMQGIRARSGLLFSTICAVGCRVLRGTESHPWRLLNFHIKQVLNAAVGTPGKTSLETIQALLVRACFTSERSLLVTIATRLAVDLQLPEAYDELSTRLITRGAGLNDHHSTLMDASATAHQQEDDDSLMRKARTWLHLLVLGHMLHVDAGDLLTFKFSGNVRRCRVLLESASCTDMDHHLFPQVELNVLRASTYSTFAGCTNFSDEEVMDLVRDARIDIGVWFNDWLRIFEQRQFPPSYKRWLTLHLNVQKCWAETMALCRAVRASGVENVDAMSAAQLNMLLMAKDALKQHLDIILEEPRDYLRNLRFAMDFVWAKCAFCFLLLLKLSMLVTEEDEQTNRTLIAHGRTLVTELQTLGGAQSSGPVRNSTNRVYLQLLQTGIEKFSRTVLGENLPSSQQLSGTTTPRMRSGGSGNGSGSGSGSEGNGGGARGRIVTGADGEQHNELESFVPEQFVFEWDFPGLTLFSSPTTEAGWLDDFLRGAMLGGEEFYGFGWGSVDPTLQ